MIKNDERIFGFQVDSFRICLATSATHQTFMDIYHHDISKKEFLWSRLQQSSYMQHKMLVLTGRRDDTNLVCTAVPGKKSSPWPCLRQAIASRTCQQFCKIRKIRLVRIMFPVVTMATLNFNYHISRESNKYRLGCKRRGACTSRRPRLLHCTWSAWSKSDKDQSLKSKKELDHVMELIKKL